MDMSTQEKHHFSVNALVRLDSAGQVLFLSSMKSWILLVTAGNDSNTAERESGVVPSGSLKRESSLVQGHQGEKRYAIG